MYSKMKIAGHPIHPMLVGFPVAFYTATLVAHAIYAAGGDVFWFRVGHVANWAGVITALAAAIPGFVDWGLGIPNGTPAKRTGLTHMLLNVCALLVFALNAVLQAPMSADPHPSVGASVILPALGVVLTIAAGFMGWMLVQTHHVGVDLTPEQERFEPRPSAPASPEIGGRHSGHGQPT